MKKGRSSGAKIIEVLRKSEVGARPVWMRGCPAISRDTLYRWRKQYGGLQVSALRRVQQLEEENRRLERSVADQALNP